MAGSGLAAVGVVLVLAGLLLVADAGSLLSEEPGYIRAPVTARGVVRYEVYVPPGNYTRTYTDAIGLGDLLELRGRAEGSATATITPARQCNGTLTLTRLHLTLTVRAPTLEGLAATLEARVASGWVRVTLEPPALGSATATPLHSGPSGAVRVEAGGGLEAEAEGQARAEQGGGYAAEVQVGARALEEIPLPATLEVNVKAPKASGVWVSGGADYACTYTVTIEEGRIEKASRPVVVHGSAQVPDAYSYARRAARAVVEAGVGGALLASGLALVAVALYGRRSAPGPA